MTEERRRIEEEHKIRDRELKQAIQTLGEQVTRRLYNIEQAQEAMKQKIDPMYEIFDSVSGFNKIAVWILKVLAAIGAALVGLYALIEFFKKISK